MSSSQRFCKECGSALSGGKFCAQCGAATESGSSAPGTGDDEGTPSATTTLASGPPTLPMSRPAPGGLPPRVSPTDPRRPAADAPDPVDPGRSGRRRMIVGAVSGGAIVAVIAILVILLTRGGGGPAYLQQARDALTPVIEANNQLSGAVQSLQPSSSGAAANTAVHSTMAALQGVQSTLSTLKPDSGDQQFAANAQAALSSELAFLTAAGSVLANPSSPSLSQLSSLGDDTKTKLQALDAQVPRVSESFPGASSIVTYAQAQSKAANTKSALRTFSDQVSGLLGQSVTSFQQINQVFGQMQTAASGGVANISLAQAEASLASVIANRTALAASARTLSAPTPLATSVRAALTASFDDSLANDQAIQTCLNQANSGDFAVLSQSCLSSTGSGATTSNQAKQHFLSLYNQLRQSIGLPATNPSF